MKPRPRFLDIRRKFWLAKCLSFKLIMAHKPHRSPFSMPSTTKTTPLGP